VRFVKRDGERIYKQERRGRRRKGREEEEKSYLSISRARETLGREFTRTTGLACSPVPSLPPLCLISIGSLGFSDKAPNPTIVEGFTLDKTDTD
jgi:hypothetical protein